jgi:prevent-host-death family protein
VKKIIGVTELQRRFRTVLDDVMKRHATYVLTRGGRPEAALVPYDQYLKYVQADEAGVLKRLDNALARMVIANAKYSDEQVESDLKDATRVIRSRKRK